VVDVIGTLLSDGAKVGDPVFIIDKLETDVVGKEVMEG